MIIIKYVTSNPIIWTGRVECVELLIKSGANVAVATNNGVTLLHLAVGNG